MNGITAGDIKAALRKLHTPRYNGPGTGRDWVLFDELRTGTNNREAEHLQSIDMWAMYTWTPSPDEETFHLSAGRSALQEAGWEPGQPLPPAFLATFEEKA